VAEVVVAEAEEAVEVEEAVVAEGEAQVQE
jgi:hypothetical protein